MKIGLIGYGAMGSLLAAYINEGNLGRIVAVCDKDYHRLALAAQREEAIRFERADDLLQQEMDVLLLCVPPEAQKNILETAVHGDYHVICTMPIASRGFVSWLKELKQQYEARGRVIAPLVFQSYFNSIRGLKADIEEGMIGEVGIVNLYRYCPLPKGGEQKWYGNFAESGGAAQLLLQDIASLCYALGAVKSVFANRVTTGSFDYISATFKLACGALATAQAHLGFMGPYTAGYEYCGGKGMLEHDGRRLQAIELYGGKPSPQSGFNIEREYLHTPFDPYRLALAACLDGLAQGRIPTESAAGFYHLSVLSSLLQSVETGLPVTVDAL